MHRYYVHIYASLISQLLRIVAAEALRPLVADLLEQAAC